MKRSSPGIIPKLVSLPIEYELVRHKNDEQLSEDPGEGPLASSCYRAAASETVGLSYSVSGKLCKGSGCRRNS